MKIDKYINRFLGIALVVVTLAGCASSQQQRAGRALTFDEQRQFNELYLSAVVAREKENEDSMYDYLERALAINPDAPEALFDMAILKFKRASAFDSTSAMQGDSMLRRAVELAPKNDYYRETFADYLDQNGDAAGAIKAYEQLCADKPRTQYLSALVRLYEQTGDYRGAIGTLERMERVEGTAEIFTIEKFKNYLALQDTAGAYRMIENLCAENPNDLRYRVLLGETYQEHGEPERAKAIYDSVLAQEPANPYAQTAMAGYYKKMGQDSLYEAYVRAGLLNAETSSETRVGLLTQYVRDKWVAHDTAAALHMMNEALQVPQKDAQVARLCLYSMGVYNVPRSQLELPLRRVLEAEPDDYQSRLYLLQIYIADESRLDETIQLCQEGALYNPTKLVFYLYGGLGLHQQGKNAEAIELLQRGGQHADDENDPDLASEVFEALGDVLHAQDRDAEAFEAYEKALKYKANNKLALNNYAYFLALKGQDLEKAEDMSRFAVESEPTNATYLDTYAWVLYKSGQYEKAKIYIDETMKYTTAEDMSADLYLHAGDIYYMCGEREAALDYWNAGLAKAEGKTADELKRKIRQRKP